MSESITDDGTYEERKFRPIVDLNINGTTIYNYIKPLILTDKACISSISYDSNFFTCSELPSLTIDKYIDRLIVHTEFKTHLKDRSYIKYICISDEALNICMYIYLEWCYTF